MTSDSKFVGNILVVRDGEVVHEASDGLADPVAGTPLTSRHRFQIASISKQFTAAATLVLADAGRLSLDDRLAKWIEGCPPAWEPITIRHLLSNSSGIGHWNDYPEIDLCEPMPVSELVSAFQTRDPFHEPGSGFRYSSAGFCLLARIVELASQRPYRRFLAEEVFAPLGMRDTFAGDGGDRADLAVGLSPEGEPLERLFELDNVGKGAGDVWSTTHDLVTWNQAVSRGELLQPDTWRAVFEPRVASGRGFGEDDHYGYGWFVSDFDGHALRFHSGDNAGFESLSCWFPDLSTHVVYLNNRNTGMGIEETRSLLRDLLRTAG